MSQEIDLFSDLEDAPVEFSGVSERQTSSSPSQQERAQPAPLPPPPPPPPPLPPPPQPVCLPGPSRASAASAFTPQKCPVCKRVLKTLKGFEAHLERHGNVASVSTASASAPPSPIQVPLASSEVEVFTCPDCLAVLKSKRGFVKHRATHRLKDLSKMVPDVALFKEEAMVHVMREICEELLNEPTYESDSEKKIFVSKLVCGNEKWDIFVLELTEFMCEIVLEKQTKIMPANQYQEAQRKLNVYLNDNEIKLRDNLLAVSEDPVNPSIAARLVFRIAFKLLKKVQVWALQKNRSSQVEEDNHLHQVNAKPMSVEEEGAFQDFIGELLRDVYRRGVKSLATKQNNCIKEEFVDGQHPLSSRQFINKKSWYSGDENCIVLSDQALNFFKTIECKILPSSDTKTAQDVLEKILLQPDLLQQWYHLTTNFFSENDSLLFMRELVKCYLKKSLKKEEEKLNRAEERTLQATAVALRTNLNRNYVEKNTADELVE